MLKNTFLGVLMLSSTLLLAQNDAQLDKMTASTCDCISKKDLSKIEASSFEMELGLCIIASLEVIPEKERVKLDFTNSKKMTELGEAIGMRMATKCPSILMKITKMYMDKGELPSASTESDNNDEAMFEGVVKDVKISDWVTLTVVNKNQKEYKILWIGHFDGESDFMADPLALIGKSVEVKCVEAERYVPQMKEYVTFKQLTELIVK